MLPKGPRFEPAYYDKVRNSLNEDPQVIRMSRSDLLHAINQVGITAGESTIKLAPSNGSLILTAVDECGNKSASKIEASGSLKEPISMNIDHLAEAIDALTDELIIMKVCNSVVEVSDKAQWEIMFRE